MDAVDLKLWLGCYCIFLSGVGIAGAAFECGGGLIVGGLFAAAVALALGAMGLRWVRRFENNASTPQPTVVFPRQWQ